MESTTKNRQSDAVLRTLIARAFGDDEVPTADGFAEEITEGWFNVLYRIRLRSGRRTVLKIAPPADVPVLTREIDMMRVELEAMRLISDRTAVPVPEILHVDLSREILDADLFFMEHIDADNFGFTADAGGLPPEVVAAGHRQLGALNREITSVVGPHFGPILGEGFATWREAFTQTIEDVLADGRRAGSQLGWSEAAIREVLDRHADTLDEVTVPRLVELDLWAKNSMIRDGRIVAVLDHERAIYGDPLIEAGLTGLDFPLFGDPSDFMAGFGITELTESERTRRRLYSLYLAVIMVVENSYRTGADPGIAVFGREQLDVIMRALGAA